MDREGTAPAEVCRRINKALAGARVYSDAPDWDGFWLYRLFSAAKQRQAFALLNFADLFVGSAPETFLRAREIANRDTPHRHRARDDVLHMRALYDLAGAPQSTGL